MRLISWGDSPLSNQQKGFFLTGKKFKHKLENKNKCDYSLIFYLRLKLININLDKTKEQTICKFNNKEQTSNLPSPSPDVVVVVVGFDVDVAVESTKQ